MIICNEGCKKQFEIKKLKERKLKDGVIEISFKCPYCSKKYICFYTDKNIRRKQKEIRTLKNDELINKLKQEIRIDMEQLKQRMLGI